MPGAETMAVRERLSSARRLLAQGRPAEAEEIVEGVIAHCAGLSKEDMVCSCGLAARLLALRGERARAWLLADLAVRLAESGTALACLADARLDREQTLDALRACSEFPVRAPAPGTPARRTPKETYAWPS